MRTKNLLRLKNEVEHHFGKTILSASDCEKLITAIQQKCDLTLSVNTLRRVFNLMKSQYQPSLYTLNVLSRFCGYTSYGDYLKNSSALDQTGNLQLSFTNLLLLVFQETDLEKLSKKSQVKLIKELNSNLDNCPDLIDHLQSEIARTSNCSQFYYEHFINFDKLNGYFGQGLQYYLDENESEWSSVFVHSLLCLRSWLSDDLKGVLLHSQFMPESLHSNHFNGYLQARIIACRLFRASIMSEDISPIIEEAKALYDSTWKNRPNDEHYARFEYVMAQTLILLEEPLEAQFFIDAAIRTTLRNEKDPREQDLNHPETLKLFKAIVLERIGKIDAAKKYFAAVQPDAFHFQYKQFNQIMYNLLKTRLGNTAEPGCDVNVLLEQTGFKKLEYVFAEKRMGLSVAS